MKYHIIAWGADDLPDLDYQSDELPADLYANYRFIDIAYNYAVLERDLMRDLSRA